MKSEMEDGPHVRELCTLGLHLKEQENSNPAFRFFNITKERVCVDKGRQDTQANSGALEMRGLKMLRA